MDKIFMQKFGKLWSGMLVLEFGMRRYLAAKEGKAITFNLLTNIDPKAAEEANPIPSSFKDQTYFGKLVAEFEAVSQVIVDVEISELRNIVAHGFLGENPDKSMKVLKIDGRKSPVKREFRMLTHEFMDDMIKKVSTLKDKIIVITDPLCQF